MEFKNPYARLASGEIVSITSASKQGNYFCVGCGGRLVVKEGKIISKHFAHTADSDCSGGLETTLHIKAKECFLKSGTASFLTPGMWNESIELTILDAKEEVRYTVGGEAIVVDVVIATKEMGDVFVEILNTHKTGPEKIKKISAIGRPCIEINVRYFADFARPDVLDQQSFVDRVTRPSGNGKWLYMPTEEPCLVRAGKAVEARLQKQYVEQIDRLTREVELLNAKIGELSGENFDKDMKIRELKKAADSSAATQRQAQKIVDGVSDEKLKRGASVGYAFKGTGVQRCVYIYIKRELIDAVETKIDKKGNIVVPLRLYKANDDALKVVANSGQKPIGAWL